MDGIKDMLKTQYGIGCVNITQQTGGWSALAYKVTAANRKFFLKIYEKGNASTAIWTMHIDDYMPILLWLNNNTLLQGKIIGPVTTIHGRYRCEDNRNIYILFDFIAGETVGNKPLTHTQTLELAEIMAQLHKYGEEIPVRTEKIREDFSLPFCTALEDYFSNGYAASPLDVIEALKPYPNQILQKVTETRLLANRIRSENTPLRLCHTDAHGWNLMQSEHLVLIDWEGLKLAPVEADLFMFSNKAYWKVFLEHYSNLRPGFILNQDLLLFYLSRRKLEDIWAFIERVLYDDLPDAQRTRTLTYLSNECAHIDTLGC